MVGEDTWKVAALAELGKSTPKPSRPGSLLTTSYSTQRNQPARRRHAYLKGNQGLESLKNDVGALWKTSTGRDGKGLRGYKINGVAITRPTWDL